MSKIKHFTMLCDMDEEFQDYILSSLKTDHLDGLDDEEDVLDATFELLKKGEGNINTYFKELPFCIIEKDDGRQVCITSVQIIETLEAASFSSFDYWGYQHTKDHIFISFSVAGHQAGYLTVIDCRDPNLRMKTVSSPGGGWDGCFFDPATGLYISASTASWFGHHHLEIRILDQDLNCFTFNLETGNAQWNGSLENHSSLITSDRFRLKGFITAVSREQVPAPQSIQEMLFHGAKFLISGSNGVIYFDLGEKQLFKFDKLKIKNALANQEIDGLSDHNVYSTSQWKEII